jgi:hypothetical protein
MHYNPEEGHNMHRFLKTTLLIAALGVSGQAADCDRTCMKGLITQYVDALVAHDPSTLPLAATVRFTEDSSDVKLGEGLWKTITKKGVYRQDYIDLKKQIAASHVELFEADAQVLYSVVLHVTDQKIAGIETLINRLTATSRFKPDSLEKPLPGMSMTVPSGRRMARADMVRAALRYPEGLRIGNFTDAKTPFSAEAYRVENGLFIAGVGGPRPNIAGLFTQKIMLHPEVIASVAAVDEEEGLVLLWMNFGDTNSYGPGNALVTFEAFKVWGNEIHSINAFFRTMAKATPRYWPSLGLE